MCCRIYSGEGVRGWCGGGWSGLIITEILDVVIDVRRVNG